MNRVPSDLSPLLLAVQSQLQTWTPGTPASSPILQAERVYISLADDDDWTSWPADDQFIVIAPSRYAADQADFAGGGTDLLTWDGVLAVAFWNRLSVDMANTDQKFLTDATLGILAQWKHIQTALSMFDPVDANGNGLLEQPMRPIAFEVRPRKRKSEWGKLASWWGIKWQQDLS